MNENSSILTLSALWNDGTGHQESVKLLLADSFHQQFYLRRSSKLQKTPQQEEREMKRLEYLAMRDVQGVNGKLSKSQALTKLMPNTGLSAKDIEISRRLLRPYEDNTAKLRLLERVKEIELRKRAIQMKSQKKQKTFLDNREEETNIYFTSDMPTSLANTEGIVEIAALPSVVESIDESSRPAVRMRRRTSVMISKQENESKRTTTWLVLLKLLHGLHFASNSVKQTRAFKFKAPRAFKAGLMVMRFIRKYYLRKIENTSVKSKFKEHLEAKKAQSKLGLRMDAAQVLIQFMRDLKKSAKSTLRSYIRKILFLQRTVRKHLAANAGRVQALGKLFERCQVPIQNHIKVVSTGKSLGNKTNSASEMALIKRMCGKHPDHYRVIVEMNTASFHEFLIQQFNDGQLHRVGAAIIGGERSLLDPAIKRRIFLKFLFRMRRQHRQKEIDSIMELIAPQFTTDDVHDFIVGKIQDPLSASLTLMLRRREENLARQKNLFFPCYSLLRDISARTIAELFFEIEAETSQAKLKAMRERGHKRSDSVANVLATALMSDKAVVNQQAEDQSTRNAAAGIGGLGALLEESGAEEDPEVGLLDVTEDDTATGPTAPKRVTIMDPKLSSSGVAVRSVVATDTSTDDKPKTHGQPSSQSLLREDMRDDGAAPSGVGAHEVAGPVVPPKKQQQQQEGKQHTLRPSSPTAPPPSKARVRKAPRSPKGGQQR